MRTEPALLALLLAIGCGGAAATAPPAEDTERPPPERPRVTVALRFEEAPDEAPSATPRTRVSIAVITAGEPTRTTEVAVAAGACSHAWPGHGVLLRARCSWADRREEITVARARDQLVVRTAAGNEQRIGLPENALVDVLQPETMPTEGGSGGVFINPAPIRAFPKSCGLREHDSRLFHGRGSRPAPPAEVNSAGPPHPRRSLRSRAPAFVNDGARGGGRLRWC